MVTYIGYIAFTFVIISQSTSAGISVTTDYESDYRDGDTFYILKGENVTLVCEYGLIEDQVYDVRWSNSQGDTEVLLFSKAVLPGHELKGTPLEDRDVTWTYTDTAHKLTIPQVNIFTDAIRYRCVVENEQGNTGEAHLDLNNKIFDAPDSVSLSTIDFVVEDSLTDIQCTVSSIYPGSEETEFKVKVGSQYYTGGTESQSQDSNGVTYKVTYRQTLSFNRNQKGQEVQCEVTWGEGPIEVTKISNTEELDVYYVPSSISRTSVSPSSQVTENTLLTLSCEVDSYPASRLRLYRQGTTSPVKSVNANTLEYKVTVDKDDNGAQFYCRSDDNNKHTGWEFDVESEKLRINVLFSATSLSLETSTSGIVSEGTVVALTCTTSESNPTAVVIWTRDGAPVSADPSDIITESGKYDALKRINTLRVTATRVLNGMVYKCAVQGISLTEEYTMVITFFATTIELTPSHTGLIAENVDITLTCVTDESNPTADIVWNRDGEIVSSGISESEVSGQYNVKKRRSVITLTTEKNLNGVQYKCQVEGQDDVSDQTVVQVKYPPEVSVQTASNTLVKDLQLVVTCNVEAGNPEFLTSQFWEFEPKYHGTLSQALPEQRENRELRIERTVYSDAGTYRCAAGNTVGSDTGEIQIVIHYPPQLVSNDPLTFYSGLGQQISLNITVRAFPEFSDPDTPFTWTTSSGSLITNGVTSTKLSHEIFHSELLIGSVTREDYTSYTVAVDNGVKGPVSFTLKLIERGLPYPPESLTFESVTSISITLSWISDWNGGSLQTFTVYHRKDGESKITYNDGIADTGFGTKIFFKATGLEPNTLYFFRVQSKNMHGESILPPEVPTKTLGTPKIKGTLEATIYKAHIILQWQQITGVYTSAKLLSCNDEMICQTIHNFTENGFLFFVLNSQYNGENYMMEVYQENDNVLSKGFIIQDMRDSTSQMTDSSSVIVVASVLSVSIVVLSTVIVVGYIFHRRRMLNNSLLKETLPQTYENITGGTESSQYEMTKPEPASLPSEYTELGHIHYDNIDK